MGVQLELPPVVFRDGAEEATFVIAKSFGIYFAGVDRGGNMTVVGGLSDIDGQFTGVKFYIFASGDVFDSDVASWNAGEEVNVLWDVDGDREFVFGAPG